MCIQYWITRERCSNRCTEMTSIAHAADFIIKHLQNSRHSYLFLLSMWLYRPYNDQDQYDGEIRSDRTRASVASKLIILVEGDCFWFQPYCSHWNWYWVYVTCGISSPELTDLIQRTIRMTVESVAEWIGINVFSGVPLLSFICISSSRVQFFDWVFTQFNCSVRGCTEPLPVKSNLYEHPIADLS